MTQVYITIDTEYSSGLLRGLSHDDRVDNFARSISCTTPDGPAGVSHKLELLKEHGQHAVFFVDPMPAMVWGVAAIEDIVGPIIEAGQDVQLHCHTEWLALAGDKSILPGKRTGINLFEFSREDQHRILDFARNTLIAAGAPEPVAFRAGNYGANDDTLRVLAELGISYDSSHCPALSEGASQISLAPEDRDPIRHCDVIEVPVGSISTLGGGQRHAQITALTLREMRAAIRHARDTGRDSFTLVSHSFELINRRKLAVNKIVRRRFNRLVSDLAAMRGVTTATYRDNPPQIQAAEEPSELLPANPIRTGLRVVEQLASNTLYGAL